MLKLKEDTLDSLLLVLMDAISEIKERECGNSGYNWHDIVRENFFDEVDPPQK